MHLEVATSPVRVGQALVHFGQRFFHGCLFNDNTCQVQIVLYQQQESLFGQCLLGYTASGKQRACMCKDAQPQRLFAGHKGKTAGHVLGHKVRGRT